MLFASLIDRRCPAGTHTAAAREQGSTQQVVTNHACACAGVQSRAAAVAVHAARCTVLLRHLKMLMPLTNCAHEWCVCVYEDDMYDDEANIIIFISIRGGHADRVIA